MAMKAMVILAKVMTNKTAMKPTAIFAKMATNKMAMKPTSILAKSATKEVNSGKVGNKRNGDETNSDTFRMSMRKRMESLLQI